MQRPVHGRAPVKKPMSPAEAAAEMLKRQQVSAESPQPAKPKPDYGQAASGIAGTTAATYALNEALAGAAPIAANPAPPVLAAATATPNAPGLFAAGGPALQSAGIAAGAYTGYQQAQGAANALKNKPLSVQEQVALALPTFGASFLVNPAQKFFGSGKDGAQQDRDAIRAQMKEVGLIGDDYMLNGVDIGKDGGHLEADGLHTYDVDFNKEGAGQQVADLNALGAILSGGGGKGMSDATGLLWRSIGSDKQKILEAYEKVGGHAGAYGRIVEMQESGQLDDETANALRNGLDSLYGVGSYASGSGSKIPSKRKGSSDSSKEAPPATPEPAPPPVTPAPSNAQPYSEQDYINAILAVNNANTSNDLKKKNPLSMELKI